MPATVKGILTDLGDRIGNRNGSERFLSKCARAVMTLYFRYGLAFVFGGNHDDRFFAHARNRVGISILFVSKARRAVG